jgi:membrane-bound lytic murein transglycosylase A
MNAARPLLPTAALLWRPASLIAALLLVGCGAMPGSGGREVASPGGAEPAGQAAAKAAIPAQDIATQDIATRHALFKVSAFDSLPGWQQDNLGEAWVAFKESCKALERKAGWKPLCVQIKAIKDPKAGRALLEREFTLLTVQNTDRTREGDITGYYEPLLQGQAQKGGNFVVPVYGVPNDMYFLDWKGIPAAQRKAVTWVRPNGRMLQPVPVPVGAAGASGAPPSPPPGLISLDLRRFTLDTLDRRLRVRLQGSEAQPYYTRADINRQAMLDAPVLAWVDDPLALYAMQVQGAGRIRLPDGRILRLQYADQNGHPFKPMRLAAQGNERVQTRGRDQGEAPPADEVEHFDLADADEAAADAASLDEPLTRGVKRSVPAAPGPQAAQAVQPLASAGAPPQAGAQQLVDDLLMQGQINKAKGGTGGGTSGGTAGSTVRAPASPAPDKAAALSASLLAQRSRALDTDPSYVFFRSAPDQSAVSGPVGALGVPLTAGRSLAVDPRVLPLGYPVFLDAAGGGKRQAQLQRLMFAQDTGGAIRGAVRADYFWGFGSEAGQQARRTKNRGRMWVMVPHAEVDAMLSSKLVTRGSRSLPEARECLVDDPAFCDDEASAEPDSAAP